MNFEIRRAKEFKTARWSGGTTTELYIYPEDAEYAKRSFEFRLSTATVETETSDFTPLPGISRKLMVLDGELTLHHEGHGTQHLRKFDVATFDGGWKTTSVGLCSDFNLMLRGNTQGDICAKWIEANGLIHYAIASGTTHVFVYLLKGKMEVHIDANVHLLAIGDLLIIETPSVPSIQFKGGLKSEAVLASVGKFRSVKSLG